MFRIRLSKIIQPVRVASDKAQVRSCMEYCSHLWDGSAKYQLAALDSVQRRAKRFIGDENLVGTKLHSSAHRRQVARLSVSYRLYFGEYAHGLHKLIPPSPFAYRSTRRTAAFLYMHLKKTKTVEEKREAKRKYMRERYRRIKSDPMLSQKEQEKERLKYLRRKQKLNSLKYKNYKDQRAQCQQWKEYSKRYRENNMEPDEIYRDGDYF